MLFQDNNLFAHLTAEQNVGLGIHPGLRLDAAQRKAVADALEQVGLSGFAQRRPEQLSGGCGRSEYPRGSRDVPADVVVRGIDRVANPRLGFKSKDERVHEIAAGDVIGAGVSK